MTKEEIEKRAVIAIVAVIIVMMITAAAYCVYLEYQIWQVENKEKVRLAKSVEYFIDHSELNKTCF